MRAVGLCVHVGNGESRPRSLSHYLSGQAQADITERVRVIETTRSVQTHGSRFHSKFISKVSCLLLCNCCIEGEVHNLPLIGQNSSFSGVPAANKS